MVYEFSSVLYCSESWKPVLAAEEILYNVVSVLEGYYFLMLYLVAEYRAYRKAISWHRICSYEFRQVVDRKSS